VTCGWNGVGRGRLFIREAYLYTRYERVQNRRKNLLLAGVIEAPPKAYGAALPYRPDTVDIFVRRNVVNQRERAGNERTADS